MYACPHCEYFVQDFVPVCPACDEDLRAVAVLNELPDVHYNRAVRAAAQGDWTTATAMAGAAVAARRHDAGAWMLLGLIAARQGALANARECLKTVLLLARDSPPAARGLRVIEQLLAERDAAPVPPELA